MPGFLPEFEAVTARLSYSMVHPLKELSVVEQEHVQLQPVVAVHRITVPASSSQYR